MDIQEARETCRAFAGKHELEFVSDGSIGFGRSCVGFAKGGNYIAYNPYNVTTHAYVFAKQIYPPDCARNAYHKDDCFAVLAGEGYAGSLDAAIIELAQWVKEWEAGGELEIVRYETGAVGLQAVFSGESAWAIRHKDLQGAQS